MADDIKSLATRIQQLEKDLKALARTVNDDQVRAKLAGLQITDLQKRGVDMDTRIKKVESK
jgi:outer membrane murein-binding lipoprotein Lpp